MLTMIMLIEGKFHNYVSIMHIHRPVTGVTLIRIFFRSQCREISALPNRTIYVTINQHKALSPNNHKGARLHTDLAAMHVDIDPIHMFRLNT